MLIQTLKLGESIKVDGPATITVLRIDTFNRVRIGIEAPLTTIITRVENPQPVKDTPNVLHEGVEKIVHNPRRLRTLRP
jgi:carbon storage regulator CsrA